MMQAEQGNPPSASVSPTGLVSVVLPVYNQAHYLPAALDGIFAQTYPRVQLIVVNDGSTDHTAAVLENYQSTHSFTVISQENQGLPSALNAGFAKAHGEYLTWTSSDNVMMPQMLEVLADALQRDPAVGLVYADFRAMDDAGNDLGLVRVPDYDPDLLLHVNLIHCCFLYRRACMDRVGTYAPGFIYSEDWEYWIRISRYFRMKHIPQTLYLYRFHATSMTSEVVRGSARGMAYEQFASHLRHNMPVRWWLGKVKWWWLRLAGGRHPAIAQGHAWREMAARAAAGSKHG